MVDSLTMSLYFARSLHKAGFQAGEVAGFVDSEVRKLIQESKDSLNGDVANGFDWSAPENGQETPEGKTFE